MCCFSGSVAHVSGTELFARRQGERQFLVYSLNVEISRSLAMILPLPVTPGAPEDAVQFIDLSGYPNFFVHLSRAFPASRSVGPASRAQSLPALQLRVHDVGSFQASFVPTRKDFARLDRRFRLADDIWDGLPEYADYGFAVFKLKSHGFWPFGKRSLSPHPMAFSFPSRHASALFFPTVHVHDGKLHPEAEFDHVLYCQLGVAPPDGWHTSSESLEKSVDVASAMGMVDGSARVHRSTLRGLLPNRDQLLGGL